MLRGRYWKLISVLLLAFLPVNIQGNKRREKPSRWKEAVDNDNDRRVGYLNTVVGNHEKVYQKTFKFTYSAQYDESCDCQRSVPSYVSQSHRDVELLESPEIPYELYLQIYDRQQNQGEQTKKDESSIQLAQLRMHLIKRDGRGALMVISSDYQPICDDEFNDRTAIAVCQLHGFKTGHRTSIR